MDWDPRAQARRQNTGVPHVEFCTISKLLWEPRDSKPPKGESFPQPNFLDHPSGPSPWTIPLQNTGAPSGRLKVTGQHVPGHDGWSEDPCLPTSSTFLPLPVLSHPLLGTGELFVKGTENPVSELAFSDQLSPVWFKGAVKVS